DAIIGKDTMTRIALYGTLLMSLLGGIFLPIGELHAQCTISNLDPTYCSSDPPVVLAGSPGGLQFYRAGVTTPIASYDPSLVIGADTVVATSGAATKDRKSTRLNSSHVKISYAVFCLKKKKT